MNKWYSILFSLLILIACGGGKLETPRHIPKHEVEKIVMQFIDRVKADEFSDNIFFFEADTEFTTEEREHYFRRLEKFIKNKNWNLYFTVIDVWEGNDDAADVILKSSSGDLIVFCLGYWYDINQWSLDAYEFPALTFDRPEEQSYEDYVQDIIRASKEVGVEYAERESIEEGSYYIEYQ